MLSKRKKWNFINKSLLLILFFSGLLGSYAQQAQRVKIDGVASVVGDFVILDSIPVNFDQQCQPLWIVGQADGR